MKLSLREKFIAIVDNDKLKKSDAIILLEGDGLNRCKKAADLLKNNWADKLVFSGGVDNVEYGSFKITHVFPELKKLGVNDVNILLDEKSSNTLEQAINIIDMSVRLNWKRIILVASHYHQYRAFLTFLKQLILRRINLELINAPAGDLLWFEELNWGKRFELLDSEFERIDKYTSLGHLATFKEAIEYQKWKELQV